MFMKVRLNLSTIVKIGFVISIPVLNDANLRRIFYVANYLVAFFVFFFFLLF